MLWRCFLTTFCGNIAAMFLKLSWNMLQQLNLPTFSQLSSKLWKRCCNHILLAGTIVLKLNMVMQKDELQMSHLHCGNRSIIFAYRCPQMKKFVTHSVFMHDHMAFFINIVAYVCKYSKQKYIPIFQMHDIKQNHCRKKLT